MANDKLTLTLDLDFDGGMTGGVRDGTGPGRTFSGWLGLLGAIDRLVAEARGSSRAPHTRGGAAAASTPDAKEETS